MADKGTVDMQIQKLAKQLTEGNRKGALSTVRSRLNDPFNNSSLRRVWKGWERALYRQENNALIHQLLNGLPYQDAKKAHQDLKRKKTEILTRDHAQTDLSKYFIATWVSLLEIYCNICQDKQ
ncbi:MAG: hypothetical protein ACTSSH_00495 [Candidatus Heimdallarchaeota archaeon]